MRWFPLLPLAGLLVQPAPATAASEAPPVSTLTGYAIASWKTGRIGEGVTLGPVRALAQDAEGYLWLGTDTALVRFDGFRFTSLESIEGGASPRGPVRALLAARDGTLWVGLGAGAGVLRMSPNRTVAGGVDPAVRGAVLALAEDSEGTVWAGHEGGLLRWSAGRWVPPGAGEGFPPTRVHHLRADHDHLLVGTASGLYVRAGGRFSRVPAAGAGVIRGSADGGNGRLVVTDPVRGFRVPGDDRGRGRAPAGRGQQILRDSLGNLWLATAGQGLWRLPRQPGEPIAQLTYQFGLLTNGIWALLEDRGGNIWVGTHEGLNRLTPQTVLPITDLGITSSVVRGSGGRVWAASSDGLIEFRGRVPARQVYPFPGIRTIHADTRGIVWVATGDGIYRFHNHTFADVLESRQASLRAIVAIASDAQHRVWFADATQGLWRYDGARLERVRGPELSSGKRMSALHADPQGTLWVAFEGGSLAALRDDGSLRWYGRTDGLLHEAVTGLYDARDGGLWITGSHGVGRLRDGRVDWLGPRNGLPEQRVFGLAEASDGALWISLGNVGLARLAMDEFERGVSNPAYRVHVRLFDTSNGMAGMPVAYDTRTTAVSDDGRLWFTTGRGLTVIDPKTIVASPARSGRVRVETAVADDRTFRAEPGVRLPAGTSRLRIDYSTVNLSAPEHTRFRYRLVGFDDGWREAGLRRQAFYTNLPPRHYRFRVQAENSDGVWQATSAEWAFSIAPRAYQTAAFYLIVVLGVAGTVVAAWRARLRQVRREFAIVLKERARLSREVHDTLLQCMVGVGLQIDAVAENVAHGRPVSTTHLTSLRREIENCIEEARLSIWNMRSGAPEQHNLIAALERAGAQATRGTGVRFRLHVTGAPSRCDERVQAEVLCIAQEALANAVRHGHPARITMLLRYEGATVTLKVIDDGVGFDPLRSSAVGHFGMLTMRERAEQLGGAFRLTTADGAGTEVEASIPLSGAA